MKKVIILLIVLVLLTACSRTPTSNTVKEQSLAQCLTEKGATMYGTEWCGYCKRQKELFGDDFKDINYIDCDKNSQECNMMGIDGYPTWIINNEKYPGLQSFEKLASLTGCEDCSECEVQI